MNTKDSTSNIHLKKEIAELKQYIEDVYTINPYEFNIASLEHYNDSAYQSITERLDSDKPQLVLYIPENACLDCIINEYEKLKTLPNCMQDRIFIMVSYPRKRDVMMWISSHKYIYPVYNNPYFGMSAFGSKNQLTLFVVNKTGIPANFLILKRDLHNMSDDYYKMIIPKFEKYSGITPVEEVISNDQKSEVEFTGKHNFGLLHLKNKGFTVFEFENISSVPFVIKDIKTNCGCTVPEWDRKPVAKGEKAKVTVEFAAMQKGVFSKRITVFSNAKDSPHTLTITGNVE
ncbi:hypothetical protein AGMMS50239_32030 [Bacteroidia bacterium]|nr:hypothetical protein AGMMS50239_32030 [Bacteroidia bacterium]